MVKVYLYKKEGAWLSLLLKYGRRIFVWFYVWNYVVLNEFYLHWFFCCCLLWGFSPFFISDLPLIWICRCKHVRFTQSFLKEYYFNVCTKYPCAPVVINSFFGEWGIQSKNFLSLSNVISLHDCSNKWRGVVLIIFCLLIFKALLYSS